MPVVPEPPVLWVQLDNVPSVLMAHVVTPPAEEAFVAYSVCPLTANSQGFWKLVPVLTQPDRLPPTATLQR